MHSRFTTATEVPHGERSSQSSSQLEVGIAVLNGQEVLLHGPSSLKYTFFTPSGTHLMIVPAFKDAKR